jgi:hypothetical protein
MRPSLSRPSLSQDERIALRWAMIHRFVTTQTTESPEPDQGSAE